MQTNLLQRILADDVMKKRWRPTTSGDESQELHRENLAGDNRTKIEIMSSYEYLYERCKYPSQRHQSTKEAKREETKASCKKIEIEADAQGQDVEDAGNISPIEPVNEVPEEDVVPQVIC